jgi:hypothetical protein
MRPFSKSLKISRRLILASTLVLALVLMPGIAVQAQEAGGEIVGTVMDPSGAAVKGATVTVTDVSRGTSQTATTNESGAYSFPRVPAGNYELTITAQGFQSVKRPAFELVLNQTARLDFRLSVGQTSETVNVSGEAPLLETDASHLNTILNARTASDLPLSTHNTNQLTLLSSPGVITPNLFGFQAA